EQQRVMLARALALEPRVLLLDEPTSALDADSKAAVEQTLKSLRARTSISIVLVTHDLEQAERMAEYVVCMHGGRLVREGAAAEVLPEERRRREVTAAASDEASEDVA
ncbi:MAG: ATP-binding cassette domain-containing protein, partial [Actinomycetota bacterium]|nr:ATP-binding cassette domain-containing protein [Actinomycetota bacterium]